MPPALAAVVFRIGSPRLRQRRVLPRCAAYVPEFQEKVDAVFQEVLRDECFLFMDVFEKLFEAKRIMNDIGFVIPMGRRTPPEGKALRWHARALVFALRSASLRRGKRSGTCATMRS